MCYLLANSGKGARGGEVAIVNGDPKTGAGTFVPDPRASLYDVPTLLGGWTDADPESYAATLDGRAYLAACRQGLDAPASEEVAKARALHGVSITRALASQLVGTRPVAIMGGHDMSRDAPGYKLVAQCAAALTQTGFTVLSGGGPGAMEAAHLGATFSDGEEFDSALRTIASDRDAWKFPVQPNQLVKNGEFVKEGLTALHRWQAPAFATAALASASPVSIGIPTWHYGHEPPTPLAPRHAKYFDNSIREDGLLAVALYGVLYAPGKAGTLQEIFQDAAQNYYRSAGGFSPMVFLDIDGYWSEKFDVKSVLAALFGDTDEKFVHYVTTVDEVAYFFEKHAPAVSKWAPSVKFGNRRVPN